MKYVLALVLMLMFASSLADELRDVPTRLFDLELGSIVVGKIEEQSSLFEPRGVTVVAVDELLGYAKRVSYRPSREFPGFPYREYLPGESSDRAQSNYAFDVLPIIPDTVSSIEEFEELSESGTGLQHEIISIRWTAPYERKSRQEVWADTIRLCRMFAADLKVSPEITDGFFGGRPAYECKFFQDERIFRVLSEGRGPEVILQFVGDVSEAKSGALERRIHQLNLDPIRPY
jgi:hypothetical protein